MLVIQLHERLSTLTVLLVDRPLHSSIISLEPRLLSSRSSSSILQTLAYRIPITFSTPIAPILFYFSTSSRGATFYRAYSIGPDPLGVILLSVKLKHYTYLFF